MPLDAKSIAKPLLDNIERVILFPLISLMMGIALLVFLWGVFGYIKNVESDEARAVGKRHMLFGIVGFVIMVSAFALLKLAANTFGIDVPQ